MAWTEITRAKYLREGLDYASDRTDAEWAVIEPHLPPKAKRGRPRTTSLRAVVNAICYIVHTCCQWRLLPKEFPPFTTVQYYFYSWRDNGTWERINQALVKVAREREGRQANPSAGIIDSQSVKTTEAGGPRGYDAGKKVKGRKRHLVTDTLGHLIAAVVHSADVQDRDGAPAVLALVRSAFPSLHHLFADAAYAGEKLEGALAKLGHWTLEIIRRSDTAEGFEALPRRWVIERTIAWLTHNRRLAKDFEATLESAHAWLMIANIKMLSSRLARSATQL
jgi:transposase